MGAEWPQAGGTLRRQMRWQGARVAEGTVRDAVDTGWWGAAWVTVGTGQVWREWAICQVLSGIQGVRWGLWGTERLSWIFGQSGV